MELKSSNKNIRIVGCAGIVAGAAMVATSQESFVHTFGTGILAGGLVFLVLPFFRTTWRK